MLTAKEGSVDLATTRVATRLTLSVYALGTHTRHAYHMLQAEAMGISATSATRRLDDGSLLGGFWRGGI